MVCGSADVDGRHGRPGFAAARSAGPPAVGSEFSRAGGIVGTPGLARSERQRYANQSARRADGGVLRLRADDDRSLRDHHPVDWWTLDISGHLARVGSISPDLLGGVGVLACTGEPKFANGDY